MTSNLTSFDPLAERISCMSVVSSQKGRDAVPSLELFGVLWNLKLPIDLQCRVLGCLPYEDVFRFKCVSKKVKGFLESDPFRGLCVELSSKRVTLTVPYFFIASDGKWQCVGFDTSLNRWRRLPPLTYLPKPEPELFKEYLVSAKGGLICVNVSKSIDKERFIVFNPLTGRCRVLPPLNHRRNPVLMSMIVDSATQAFKVVVAGSSSMYGELRNFSSITEVFDSSTSVWKVTGNLPGPDFALNEFQTGVYQDGNILCIAFLEAEQKAILVYNVDQGRWLTNWATPLPFSASTNSTILQLVECSGKVYLFSEQEDTNGCVIHCVDRLEWTHLTGGAASGRLTNVIRSKKIGGGRSLEIYPEYTCVAYAESQLCIFNTVSHTGMIYDVHHDGPSGQAQVLQAPPQALGGECFYSLNPLSFPLDLSFTSQVDDHHINPS
ncbi:hypothetical protein M758_8G040600 [Ceratodon purpureus]|nr:hypothetical protein M758_8G040600 [Ceratodon purpureus]